jgi:hypothetical protein
MPRTRALLRRAGLTAYLLVAGWLLLELAALAGLVSWARTLTGTEPIALGFRPSPHREFDGETHMDTAWTLGIAGDPIPFYFRTDGLGFRNDVDRDAADVYLLGDSIVVGPLVPFAETVTALLEEALGRPAMNLALLSIGPQRAHDVFRELDLPVRDRLVVQFLFEGNDLGDSRSYREPRTPKRRERSWLERAWRKSLARNVHKSWREARRRASPPPIADKTCRIDGQLYTFKWTRTAVQGRDQEMPRITDAIDRFAGEIRAGGGRYAVVLVPSKYRVLEPLCRFPEGSPLARRERNLSPFPAFLAEWSDRSGIPVLDLTGPLQAAARAGEIPWFWGDTHWNPTGHRIAANALASWDPVRGSVGGAAD